MEDNEKIEDDPELGYAFVMIIFSALMGYGFHLINWAWPFGVLLGFVLGALFICLMQRLEIK